MDKKNLKTVTHIKGFDKLIDGGFPKGSNILISGSIGTGKTIFSLEYLYKGIKQEKEKGIYFTFEEKRNSLIEQAIQFNWNLEKLEKENKLKIISMGIEDINKNTVDEIIEIIKNTKTNRVVIDSITTLLYIVPRNNDSPENIYVKKFLYQFLSKLRELENITTLIVSQKDEKLSDKVAQYICDGVISIEYESLGGDFSRNLLIRKMRKIKNDEDLHPMEISKEGVIVHDLE